jgi:stage V sporulation protein B
VHVSEQGRRLRRDVVWNLVPVVLLGVVGLGLNFIIGGWWGPAALGSFNLVTTVFFALAVIGACGLQYSVLRSVAEKPDDRDRVAAVVVGALIPNVVLAALAAVAFVAIRHPVGALLDSEAVAEGMLWAAPGLFCFSVNKVLLGVVNGLRRMRAFAIYTSLRYLLIAAGLVLARFENVAADHLAVIWTFTEGALLLALLGELLATVSLRRRNGWMTWARHHLAYGVRGVTATLAAEINSKLDVWMLGIALPDAQVGIYSLAAALNEGVIQLGVVLQNNFNPVIARHLADGRTDEVEALAGRTRRWFVPAMFGVCLVAALLYPVVIPWLIGNHAFADGAVPFAILMAGIALASPYLPFQQMLLMAGRPGWHAEYVVAILAVAFAGNRVLIPMFDATGAAVATAAAMGASALLLRMLVRGRLGVRI